MESVEERIARYKKEYFKTNNYYLKTSLFNIIYSLEFYTGNFDMEFRNIVFNDKRIKEIRDYKHEKLSNEFEKLIKNNQKAFDNILEPYRTEYVPSEPYQEEYIDPNTCLKIVGDFLFTINPYIYNLFCELYSDNRLLFSPMFDSSSEINLKKRDTIHVFCKSLCKVSDMATLAHEMGHAYKDYCIPEYHDAFELNGAIRSEISSMTLELMFVVYLINNNIYREDALKCLNYLENLTYEKANKYPDNIVYNAVGARSLSYLLGGIIANNYVFEPNMSYDDLIRKIYYSNINTIIRDLNKNNKVKKFHF